MGKGGRSGRVEGLLWAGLAALALVAGAIAQGPPFEDEILAFEKADAANPPAPGGIVFVGSSSIRLWTSLERDFPGLGVLNRGFGGSQIADSVRNVHRIVTPYRPRQVVFFAGTNDIAGGKEAAEVTTDFRRFVRAVHERLPDARITYLSITPAPSRRDKWPVMRRANAMIRAYCGTDRRLNFVDMQADFLTPDGGPRPELFQADQLHLNAAGYALWARRVRPYLLQ